MAHEVIMLQKEDLMEVVAEIVESLFGDRLPQKQDTEKDEYLTREEACARLHVTYSTIWRMAERGVLHVHKLGRRNLYSKKEIDELIAHGAPLESSSK
ncbi:MAG: helix-turn-helix domain-containing protein [Prevotellaceae bacterium]|nr:helix-turn-helix domain-containing protein [Prevotellaceae bacterium]